MGYGSGLALTHGEGVPTNEVCALAVGIVESVEEIGGGRGEEVANVLLEGVDVMARRILGDEAVIVDGVDVLFLGYHVPKAPAGAVFEADAPGLVAKDALNVVAVVQLIVESGRDFHLAAWISVLDDDNVVRLEEWSPAKGQKRDTEG